MFLFKLSMTLKYFVGKMNSSTKEVIYEIGKISFLNIGNNDVCIRSNDVNFNNRKNRNCYLGSSCMGSKYNYLGIHCDNTFSDVEKNFILNREGVIKK